MCMYEENKKLAMFKRQAGMKIDFMRLNVMSLINWAWVRYFAKEK